MGEAVIVMRSIGVMVAACLLTQTSEARGVVGLSPVGGPGGTPFETACPGIEQLIGLRFSLGPVGPYDFAPDRPAIAGVAPICAIAVEYNVAGPQDMRDAQGGEGVGFRDLVCPPSLPFVNGMRIGASKAQSRIMLVDRVTLHCRGYMGSGCETETDAEEREACEQRNIYESDVSLELERPDPWGRDPFTYETVPDRGLSCLSEYAVVSITGASGAGIDRLGFNCDKPQLAARTRPTVIYGLRQDNGLDWFLHEPAVPALAKATLPSVPNPAGVLHKKSLTGPLFPTGAYAQDFSLLEEAWGDKIYWAGSRTIYFVRNNRDVYWLRHNAIKQGNPPIVGPYKFSHVVPAYKFIIPTSGPQIYAITEAGRVDLWAYSSNDNTWKLSVVQSDSTDWTDLRFAFKGTGDTYYTVKSDGRLQWFGTGGGPSWFAPAAKIGTGWSRFTKVFAADAGSIYAVTQQGDLMLSVYRNYQTGAEGGWEGPIQVGASINWNDYKSLAAFPVQ